MNNADFSKLLASGDKALLHTLSRRPKRQIGGDEEDRPQKRRRAKPKKDGTNDETTKDEGPTWRDRAKERQAGEGEYKQVAEEFEQHAEVSVEESKFLGGDMDHTHLVKGLDYALLGKVRAELNKYDKQEKARGAELERRKDKKKKGMTFHTLVGRKVFQSVIDTIHPHHVQFQQRLTRMSKSISLGQRVRGAPVIFQPGHMMYEFDVDVNIGLDDIPKFVTRSREECAPMDWSQKPGHVDGKVIQILTTVLSDIKGRRRARKEAEEEKKRIKSAPSKPEDDIFQGAGGFDATTESVKPATHIKKMLSRKSLFDDLMLGKTIKSTTEKDFQPSAEFLGDRPGWEYMRGNHGLGYYRKGAAASSSTTKPKRIYAKASEENDAYGEFFPNIQMYDHSIKEDETEKADKGKGKEKGKGKGKGKSKKNKWDGGYDSDEREDKYATEGSKQYGSKHHLEGGGGGPKKGKLNEEQQWDRIEQMIAKGSVPTMDSMESRAAKKRK